jgi:hypothetical protein
MVAPCSSPRASPRLASLAGFIYEKCFPKGLSMKKFFLEGLK